MSPLLGTDVSGIAFPSVEPIGSKVPKETDNFFVPAFSRCNPPTDFCALFFYRFVLFRIGWEKKNDSLSTAGSLPNSQSITTHRSGFAMASGMLATLLSAANKPPASKLLGALC